jgi:CHAT domain-containing protein/tetratricopeptide (TPR) repeat protein
MRTQRIGLIALLTVLATLTIDNFQLIQNPKFKIPNSQVLAQTPSVFNANTLQQMGKQQYQANQFAAAFQSWQQALNIYRELKQPIEELHTLFMMGDAYTTLGNAAKAIECYQQALAIARKTHDQLDESRLIDFLGSSYAAVGNYAKAIEYYQQLVTNAQEKHDQRDEVEGIRGLGNVYYLQDNYAKAIEYYQQALTLTQNPKNDRRDYGIMAYLLISDLGEVYKSQGNYAKAIEYYQQALAMSRKLLERNYRDDQYRVEGPDLKNLGDVYYLQGNYAKAIEYYQQALTMAREIHDRQSEGEALDALGDALRKLHHLPEAEKTLQAAIQIWEGIRTDVGADDANKVSIFQQQTTSYLTLQQVLIAQNQPNAAVEIAERGRARAFVELLASRISSRQSAPTQPALHPTQPPAGEIVWTPPSTPTQVTPPSLKLLQQVAHQQQATLVEYSIIRDDFKINGKQEFHESELYIWVIKPTGEITFHTSDLKPLWQQQNTSLAGLVDSSRDFIGVRGLPIIGILPRPGFQQRQKASLTEQLQQLHKLLIEPIADLLPTNPDDHIIFIPQGSLFLVPFSALQDKDGKYLIEKHTILTAPSIQVLQLTHEQRQRARDSVPKKGNDVLVVGNPTMPSVPPEPGEKPQPLSSLPGAETEAKAIADVLHTQPLIGNKATKSAVEQLMSKARIIHLATHGLLDDVRGLGSAIALAPDSSYKDEIGKVNGLLTAEEILDLQLNAELVVLSACNTGRGRITGDGVIGLSRSLISAGVPSVLVSLWSVPDAPTAQLMTEFYQNLQKNPDKAQALRQAMLTIMKQHPNPKDWAAFTLIGESN